MHPTSRPTLATYTPPHHITLARTTPLLQRSQRRQPRLPLTGTRRAPPPVSHRLRSTHVLHGTSFRSLLLPSCPRTFLIVLISQLCLQSITGTFSGFHSGYGGGVLDYPGLPSIYRPVALPATAPAPSQNLQSQSVGDDDCADDGSTRAIKRQRLVWTPQLHKKFESAVNKLGVERAVPKNIMQVRTHPCFL